MKKKKYIVFVFFIIIFFNNCSNKPTTDSSFNLKKLEYICKVWGFLKYYQPAIKQGSLDWDSSLLMALQESDSIRSKLKFNELISNLISHSELENKIECQDINMDMKIHKKYPINWLEDTTYISNSNILKLQSIYKTNKICQNYYVTQDPDVGNLFFDNEKIYADSIFPSKNLRLLALFRYWNIMYYFHPYRELNDVCWNNCLIEFIPKFINIKDTIEYHLKVQELTVNLNDGHVWTESLITGKYWGVFCPPIKLKNVENKPIIYDFYSDSLANLFDVQLGDQILFINGISIDEIIENRKIYYPFSNSNQFIRRILEEILISPDDDPIKLLIKRHYDTINISVKPYYLYELYQIQDKENKNKPAYSLINEDVGYINLEYLEKNEIPVFIDRFLSLEKIIIDIRNYPDNVLYALSDYFNPVPEDFVKVFMPNVHAPGEFIWDTTLQTGTVNNNYFRGKLILLVDEQTQSHAEFTAMCFQSAPNVITIGSTTAGTDGNVSYVYLPGGIITYFTSIGIVYPDHTQTYRLGVKIDTIVLPQIEDYYSDYDRLLITAVML